MVIVHDSIVFFTLNLTRRSVELSRHECRVASQEAEAARRAARATDELRELVFNGDAADYGESAQDITTKKDVLKATSSLNLELSVERRHRLELSSQLVRLQMEYDILQRKRRVDDLRITSLSEDVSMLTSSNRGLEHVSRTEHDVRVQLEGELEELKAGSRIGNEVCNRLFEWDCFISSVLNLFVFLVYVVHQVCSIV